MSKPLPTNIELLLFLANESGKSYYDVYAIWCHVYKRPDSYLVVETVLYIAKTYRLPIMAALTVWQRGPVDFRMN